MMQESPELKLLFQSRNRESSIFYYLKLLCNVWLLLFQSRNRESSIFYKREKHPDLIEPIRSFNLVIENLLFSTLKV